MLQERGAPSLVELGKREHEVQVWIEQDRTKLLLVLPTYPTEELGSSLAPLLLQAGPGVSLPACSFQTPGMWLLVLTDEATHLLQAVSPVAPPTYHTWHLTANGVPEGWV